MYDVLSIVSVSKHALLVLFCLNLNIVFCLPLFLYNICMISKFIVFQYVILITYYYYLLFISNTSVPPQTFLTTCSLFQKPDT